MQSFGFGIWMAVESINVGIGGWKDFCDVGGFVIRNLVEFVFYCMVGLYQWGFDHRLQSSKIFQSLSSWQ